MDDPIDFTYEDTDSYQNEICELYSYSEEPDFFANRNAFEESMEDCGLPLAWKHMVEEQKSRAINYLMTTLEVSCRATRIKSCRGLAYLVQGNFGECLSLEEQATISKENVFRLYEQGIFNAFVLQLLMEINLDGVPDLEHQINFSPSQIFNDSSELRLILSVLCTITETMYHAKDSKDPATQEYRKQFISELQCPIRDEYLSVILFQMLNNFCSGLAPHYPVRKIVLLLWKIILITLGGTSKLEELRDRSRTRCKLDPPPDKTFEVTKIMRPCSPLLAPDGQAKMRTATVSGLAANKRKVLKQPAIDDAVFAYAKECLLNLAEYNQSDIENEPSDESNELNDSTEGHDLDQANSDNSMDLYNLGETSSDCLDLPKTNSDELNQSDVGISPDSESGLVDISDHLWIDNESEAIIDDGMPGLKQTNVQNQGSTSLNRTGSQLNLSASYKGLPWAPKIRKTDLQLHLSNIRQKFLGYTLPNDLETTFGLPIPIIEGLNVLKKHMYTSLSEVQLEREEQIERFPLTHGEINPDFGEEAAEKLYRALLPRLPQYMIALLKILLAASTNTKNKSERTESINIMAEVNSEIETECIIQSMKNNADTYRHKEVMIKAISAILILLLKHFKVNHIYQFEYVSQQLMFANCIPLILKFLSQDVYKHIVASKSSISAIDFPACVIGEQPELTTGAIELCSFQPYCWRNMFSCINLLRILNKLTKWKHSRIMMLVVFKSAPTLTRALSVRHSMFQLYVLKLLKVQLRFLGKPWKKNNMKLMSAIYQKVRHRLTDDWAYSNENEVKPWDFQAEEFALQSNINEFHRRRYTDLLSLPSGRGRTNSIVFDQSNKQYEDIIDGDYDFGTSDFASQISPHFERNYERWLESEVFQRNIDWDRFLGEPS